MSMIAKWRMALLFAGEKDSLHIYIYIYIYIYTYIYTQYIYILYIQREKFLF